MDRQDKKSDMTGEERLSDLQALQAIGSYLRRELIRLDSAAHVQATALQLVLDEEVSALQERLASGLAS